MSRNFQCNFLFLLDPCIAYDILQRSRFNAPEGLRLQQQMNHMLDIVSRGITSAAHAVWDMASLLPLLEISSNQLERKRKRDMSPEVSQKGVFPIFSPSSSPLKPKSPSAKPKSPAVKLKSPAAQPKSPSATPPSKKRCNSVIRQGANQNNKILRYLQPKRLLKSFDGCSSSSSSTLPSPLSSPSEKKDQNFDVRVTLVRLEEENTAREHSFCVKHLSPRKYCCDTASELVVQQLDRLMAEKHRNPCRRLGVAAPVCVRMNGCHHSEDVGASSSYQDTLLSTMVNADLQVMMLRACCQDLCPQSYPSPPIIHAVFGIMEDSADKKIVAFGRSYLKRVLAFHPPCTQRMKKYYIAILHSPSVKVNMPSGLWSLRTFEFFEKVLTEVEQHVEALLNPSQLKDKLKTPGVRKIVKPKRFWDSPSPVKKPFGGKRRACKTPDIEDGVVEFDLYSLSEEAKRKKRAAKEALREMSDTDRTDHIFARFEILVDILEWDLVVWLTRNLDFSIIQDRSVSPLVVLALWRPEADTGFDSVHCRRIFSVYASSWILKFHPRHLRTLARLIGLIAEVIHASEPNPGNVYPHLGEACENLSRKLCDVIRNINEEDIKNKAIAMIKPDWLKMLISARMLDIQPSMSSVVSN